MPTARTRTRPPTETWGTGIRTGSERTVKKSNGQLISYYPYDTGTINTRTLRRRDVSMDDYLTDRFFVRRLQGEIMNNDMTQRWYDIEATLGPVIDSTLVYENSTYRKTKIASGHCDPWTTAGLGAFSTDWGGPSYLPSGIPSVNEDSLKDQAISEAFARISQAPLNAWVIVGEAEQTFETVYSLLNTIALILVPRKGKSIIREVRKRVDNHRYITWDDLAQIRDLWLNVRYGLRPLMYDLLGALKAIESIGSKARQRFTSGEYSDSSQTVTSTNQSSILDGVFRINRRGVREIVFTARAGVLVEPQFENLTLFDVIGAGNLAVGVWDLVPYSFVIDWFANVSNVIASWAPLGSAHPVASWLKTQKRVIDRTETLPTGSLTYVNPWNGYSLVSSSGTLTRGYVQTTSNTVARTANPQLPVIPRLTWKLNVTRKLDLLALGSQFLRWK